MTALDDRIRALAPAPEALPPVDRIRGRAARRRARRRTGTAISVVAVLLAAVVVVGLGVRSTGESPAVVAGPTTVPPAGQIAFGGATGVTITVMPADGLVEGQEVEVRVEGLERLPGAQLAMCRGDIGEAVGLADCDLGALGGQQAVNADQVVRVSASLVLAGREAPYDCATEPAGCVVAVGTIAPTVKGVAVPVTFLPGTAPAPGSGELSIGTTSGLEDRQIVTVSGRYLRPERHYAILQCASTQEDPSVCAGDAEGTAWDVVTSSSGTFSTIFAVDSSVWSSWDGVVDCRVQQCRIQLFDEAGVPVTTSSRLSFLDGAAVDEPRLTLDPTGPYTDGQVVQVRGTGFKPGSHVGGRIGQCPAGLDTRREERCGYTDVGENLVAEDGTFTSTIVLRESLMLTGSCREGPGCLVGWVINHGPTVAEVPLTFR